MAEKKFNAVAGFSVGSPGNVIDVVDNVANVYANRIFVTQYSNLGDVANVYIGGGTNNQVLKTDGSGNLYWALDTAPAGGNTTEVQFNENGSLAGSSAFSFDNANTLLTITGNIITNNASLGNLASANYFSGNGSLLTSITGANVTGTVSTAITAATVTTNAQPNITSVGTLSSLTVSGIANIAYNQVGEVLKLSNASSAADKWLSFKNLYGQLQIGTQGNVGAYIYNTALSPLDFYTGAVKQLSIATTGETQVLSSTEATSKLTGALQVAGGVGITGNVYANYYFGNASSLSGTIANANYATFAGTVTTNAQPNITSVGTLADVTITGLTTASGGVKTPNIVDASGTTTIITKYNNNTGDVGIAANLTVGSGGTGNLKVNGVSDLGPVGNVKITGGFTNAVLTTDGAGVLSWATPNYANYAGTVTAASQPNITSLGTLASLTAGDTTINGNLTVNGTTSNLSVSSLVVQDNMIDISAETVGTPSQNAGFRVIRGDDPSLQFRWNESAANWQYTVDGFTYLNLVGKNSDGNINVGNITAISLSSTSITGTLTTAAQPNITSVGTLTNTTLGSTNSLTGGNLVSATYLTGTLTTAAQPNITSLGTLASLDVTGNVTSGNAFLGNLASANYLTGTLTTSAQPNITSLGTLASLNVTATITSGNANLGNLAVANYVTGTLTTASQPNITSVGTLADANIQGNVYIGGNLIINGTTEYTNVNNLYIKDPIIEMGGNANAGALTSNDGKDRGTLLHYYTTAPVDAFMGWDNSNAEFGFGSNVSVSSEVVTWNQYGNIRASYYLGSAELLTGVIGQSNYAAYAGNVTIASQPNITSVGTLSSLTVTGLTTATGGVKTANILDTAGTVTIQTKYNNVSGDIGVTGNIVAGAGGSGNVTATYFVGNGASLTHITGGNVTGQVANALIAGTVYTNAQPNITSLGTLNNFTANGNVNLSGAININLGSNAAVHISGGTTGQVLKTDGSGNLYWGLDSALPGGTNSQVQFNDNGSFSGVPGLTFDKFTNTLSIVGNVETGGGAPGNISGANYVIANYFVGNGYYLTGIATGSNYSNANVANFLPTYTGELSLGNANASGNITATYFIGNGSQLTGLPESYSNANVALYLPTYTGNFAAGNIGVTNTITANYVTGTLTTAAQPNITSVGVLSALNVSGNAIITGNLVVSGTAEYTNVNNLYIKDPIIEMGGNANAGALTSNDGKDRGTLLHYYTTSAIDAFMGWDSSNGEFAFGSNVSTSSDVVTFNNFGNVRASYFLGNASQLVGTIANATYAVSAGSAGSATTAGTVTTSAQPNITSVGTLSSVSITANASAGNILTNNLLYANGVAWNLSGTYSNSNVAAYLPTYTGNVSANYFIGNGSTLTNINGGNVTGQVGNALVAGTVYTNAQPNITSVGTLTTLIVSGNANVNGTLYANTIVGPSSANVTITAGAFVSRFDDTGNITLSNNVSVVNNLSAANVLTNNLLYANGVAWNLGGTYSNTNVSNFLPTYTGNVSANYFIGNGSTLTNLTGANVTGTVANATYATSAGTATSATTAATVTTAAQPNITSVGSLSGLTVSNSTGIVDFTTTANVTLGAVGNLHISGGTSGQYLQTNGSGTLTWTTISTSSLSNGTSNVSIPTADGNVNTSVGGVANVVVVSTTGAGVTGNLEVSSRIVAGTGSGGSITGANLVSANYFVGNGSFLTGLPASYANSNVAAYLPTYTGNVSANFFIGNGSTLTDIVGGNVSGQVSNALVSGTVYANAQPNITSVGTLTSVSVTSNVSAGNIKSDNLLYANGAPYVFTTTAAGSNTQIQFNDNTAFAGNANLTFNKTTNTVTTDNIDLNGNITVNGLTDLGSISNITITGGTSGYVLTTDGSGVLTWGAAGSGAAGLVSISKDRFLTTGSANTFSLSTTPASKNLIEVVIDGLQQISNTYSLTGSVLSFPTNPAAGQIIEVTTFGAVDLTGNIGEVQYNAGGAFGSSNTFTFNSGTNTLAISHLVASGNLTSQAGYVYVNNGIIAVDSGNAGIFNTGVSNINLGLAANVTVGSTTGNTTIRGNVLANSGVITNLGVNNYYSGRDAVTVTTDTIIDQFPVNTYRSAKYTMRVNSDDGYQAVEVLLVHNGSSSYVTIYGSISSSGSDIITMSSNIGSGNVRLFASTASTNTNVKILGTYVPD